MCGYSRQILYFFVFLTSILATKAIFQHVGKVKPNQESISLVFQVCNNTVQLSEQPLMYIVDFHASSAVQPLIQSLHDSSIKTVLITHPKELMSLASQNLRMNIIFFVKDPNEILNLILSSSSNPPHRAFNSECNKIGNSSRHSPTTFTTNRGSTFDSKIPNYCVSTADDRQDTETVDCDERMTLSTAELEGSEFLTVENLKLTRALYTNSLWNSRNYLSFMIGHDNYTSVGSARPKRRNEETGGKYATIYKRSEYQTEILSFKFIWRFFKGIRTIICDGDVCDRYDPFTESIVSYSGEVDEPYFDFSVTNVFGKNLHTMLSDEKGVDIDANGDLRQDGELLLLILEHFWVIMNSTNGFTGAPSSRKGNYSEIIRDHLSIEETGQLFDNYMHFVRIAITAKDIPYSSFDHSVGVETRAICFLTPHSKKVPQFLVPFKSFSPLVWFLIGVVVATFVLMQHAFQCAQLRIFRGVYSEAEIRIFENTSSLLSIYAYFMSGSPPRLVLGNFLTGKILFFIFSFSALIITTAFLGVMTTLLTKTVQYPEIDSLEDLQDTDFLIQTSNADEAAVFFDRLGEFEKLKAKLVSNLDYYTDSLYIHFQEHPALLFNLANYTQMNSTHLIDEFKETLISNIHTVVENDAFLVALPCSLISKNDIRMKIWLLPQYSEHHLVRECLMTHPVFYSLVKYSFLFDRLNQVISRFLESGHVEKFTGLSSHDDNKFEVAPLPPDDAEPRPYNLDDLQLGFIGLMIGLFFSFLVFIAEMVMEDFENVVVIKYLRRMVLFFP